MPLYELSLVFRTMPKNELVDAIKRCANQIWNHNGVIMKMDFLGHKKMPISIPSQNEGERYHEGSYFICDVSINGSKLKEIRPEYRLDLDLLNSKFLLKDESALPKSYECTLEEELKPPAFRSSVQPLLNEKNVRADVRR